MKAKKLLVLLLALVLSLSIPTVAFADGAGPHYTEIKATVEKEGGIPFYEQEWDEAEEAWNFLPSGELIPQGTALLLTGEFEEDDETYYALIYKDAFGYVRGDGIRMDLTAVEPADENAYHTPLHYVVIDPAGAKVYKGPGKLYDVVKTLPAGKEITVTHADDLSPEEGYSIWDYSPEARGWVQTGFDYEESPSFAKSVKYAESSRAPLGTLKTRVEMPVYAEMQDIWDEDSLPVFRIPAGEELEFETYYGNQAYLTYQGKTGWMQLDFGVEAPVNGYLMTLETKPLYTEPAVNETTGTGRQVDPYQILPYDLVLPISDAEGVEPEDVNFYEYAYSSWYRVTVDGTQYWMRFHSEINKDPLCFYSARKCNVAETVNLLLFKEPSLDSERVGKVYGEEQILELFDYYISEDAEPGLTQHEREWHYIVAGDLHGWSCYEYDAIEQINDDLIYSLDSFLKDPAKNALTELLAPADSPARAAAAAQQPQAGSSVTAAKTSPRTIILGCVAAAVILALVAAVTILLVRRKKAAAPETDRTEASE